MATQKEKDPNRLNGRLSGRPAGQPIVHPADQPGISGTASGALIAIVLCYHGTMSWLACVVLPPVNVLVAINLFLDLSLEIPRCISKEKPESTPFQVRINSRQLQYN